MVLMPQIALLATQLLNASLMPVLRAVSAIPTITNPLLSLKNALLVKLLVKSVTVLMQRIALFETVLVILHQLDFSFKMTNANALIITSGIEMIRSVNLTAIRN